MSFDLIILKDKIGLSIINVYKFFHNEAYEDNIPTDLKDIESDGDVYLVFSDYSVVLVSVNTGEFCLKINSISLMGLPLYTTKISLYPFWKSYIGIEIIGFKYYESYDIRCGFIIVFKTNTNIFLKYASETQYTFDTLLTGVLD